MWQVHKDINAIKKSYFKNKQKQYYETESYPYSDRTTYIIKLRLGESTFLLLEYSVEYIIEYSSTRQGQ